MPFTPAQITAYLKHLNVPPPPPASPTSLAYLARLHVAHITTVPFESLSLHYTPLSPPHIDIEPSALLRKILANNRGGYCFECAIPFLHLILSLGYKAYPAGARSRNRVGGIPQGDYMGFAHIVILVDLGHEGRFLVDVGFGGDGPTRPVSLVEDSPQNNYGLQECRLMFQPLDQPSQCLSDQSIWHYQCRTLTDAHRSEWATHYVFTELEFLQSDFVVMSYYASTNPRVFFTYTPLCMKFLEDKHVEGKVVGRKTLVLGEVKVVDGAGTRTIRTCKTEEERIDALQEEFGISLTHEEVVGIRGRPGELKGAGAKHV